MARIGLDHVTKRYLGGVPAVNDLSLDIADGEFMVLVGPSGSGKSTALRMIAGLEDITSGEIAIGDRVVNDLPPKDRDIAMVFQNYALYPHMTVRDNLAFGLQLRKTPKDEQTRRVAEAARILGLEPYLDRKPAALSGGAASAGGDGPGDRARAAGLPDGRAAVELGRQAAGGDARRAGTAARPAGVTSVYVTHDQIEAMTLGTRGAVLKDGELQQVDTPPNLFAYPRNLFVAGFIGSPAMNLVEARLVRDGGPAVTFADYRLPVAEQVMARPGLDQFLDKQVIVGSARPASRTRPWPAATGRVGR
jgi:multiple sugar transport system ATP-binding protein